MAASTAVEHAKKPSMPRQPKHCCCHWSCRYCKAATVPKHRNMHRHRACVVARRDSVSLSLIAAIRAAANATAVCLRNTASTALSVHKSWARQRQPKHLCCHSSRSQRRRSVPKHLCMRVVAGGDKCGCRGSRRDIATLSRCAPARARARASLPSLLRCAEWSCESRRR